MFNIKWKHTCFECSCPLAVKMTITVDESKKFELFCRDFRTWCYLKPFCLIRNTFFYKFYGLGVRRVCASCYYHPMRRISLLNMELNTKQCAIVKRSKTSKEIYNYFNSFVEFRKRSDLEICIVEEYKRKFTGGLLAYWQVNDTLYHILY